MYFQDIKPVSANSMYNAFRGSVCKSSKYKAFEKEISALLSCRIPAIRHFESLFTRKENSLSCRVIIEIPRSDFYTKDGFIPKKRNDIDNFNKTLIDSVFKSFKILDDSYILELISIKRLSKDGVYNARIRLEIGTLD